MAGIFGNIGDLSKPVDSLVNKVSEGISGLARPFQIKRVAHAERQAKIIDAEARVEVQAIEERARQRVAFEKLRNQQAIESITQKAIPHIAENSSPEKIPNDWIAYFFEHCKLVTDDIMQEHWARLLAREANLPSAVSRRAIQTMSQLEKHEAELFSLLRRYAVTIDDKLEVMVWYKEDKIAPYENVTFELLMHLSNIGLISFDTSHGFGIGQLNQLERITYFGEIFLLSHSDENFAVETGNVLLTAVGRELMPFCEGARSQEFLNSIFHKMMAKGVLISCPLNN